VFRTARKADLDYRVIGTDAQQLCTIRRCGESLAVPDADPTSSIRGDALRFAAAAITSAVQTR
jgi:hypothetical protein